MYDKVFAYKKNGLGPAVRALVRSEKVRHGDTERFENPRSLLRGELRALLQPARRQLCPVLVGRHPVEVRRPSKQRGDWPVQRRVTHGQRDRRVRLPEHHHVADVLILERK